MSQHLQHCVIFNTLAVVGLATIISPLVPGQNGEPAFSHYILIRDIPLMTALSLSIMFFGMNWKHPKWPGVIQRKEAWAWIFIFVAYTLLMFYQETHQVSAVVALAGCHAWVKNKSRYYARSSTCC